MGSQRKLQISLPGIEENFDNTLGPRSDIVSLRYGAEIGAEIIRRRFELSSQECNGSSQFR